MAEFLEDPSVLTKERLKNELAANNVPLPSGEHKKEVYVQLYLKNLTVLNNQRGPPPDAFSSDEELPAPVVVSSRSRSGRKATKKTDKPRTEEVEVTELTDEDLKQQLAKHGVDPGPIVASTRKLYEKKLQKLLDQPPAPVAASEPDAAATAVVTALPKADSNQNGNTNSDQYSDKEDEEITTPEPVPVVEKPVRSRGKAPVTARTSSRRQTKAAEETVVEETPKKASDSVVEDILANEISSPTGISATCRRPIRGAAGRPVKPSEYWLDESRAQHSVHTETRSYTEHLSRPGAGVPSAKAAAGRGLLSLVLKLLFVAALGCVVVYCCRCVEPGQVDGLRRLLNRVVVPLQGAASSAATYLGIPGGEERGGE